MHYLPNKEWTATCEKHTYKDGILTAIDYVSESPQGFVQVTMTMAVTDHNKDTGTMDLFGPVDGAHIQTRTTEANWNNGVFWDTGLKVRILTTLDGNVAQSIKEAAIVDDVIKDPSAYAAKMVLNDKDLTVVREAEAEADRIEFNVTPSRTPASPPRAGHQQPACSQYANTS